MWAQAPRHPTVFATSMLSQSAMPPIRPAGSAPGFPADRSGQHRERRDGPFQIHLPIARMAGTDAAVTSPAPNARLNDTRLNRLRLNDPVWNARPFQSSPRSAFFSIRQQSGRRATWQHATEPPYPPGTAAWNRPVAGTQSCRADTVTVTAQRSADSHVPGRYSRLRATTAV